MGAAIGISLGCAQCRNRDLGAAGRDGSGPSAARLVWLRNTDLLDGPQGHVLRKVVDPVMVEMTPEGHVRTTATATDALEPIV
jgi:hypothetical protein